ncbi:MAG: carboxymuconolactone decarboxylase family protein [Alphaproteobacteria bacterium]|nr:carboxymuconolactone decarboxylase family protein [Alphaproteobacteria bacterium]
MRLPPADPAADPELAEALARFQASRGIVSNVMRSYGHAPRGLSLLAEIGAYCRYGTALSELERELVILTVARGVAYAWHHHRPIAAQLGLSEAQLDALWDGQVPAGLDAAQAALVRYVMAYATLRGVPAAEFEAVCAHYTPRQVTDMNVTAGYFLCIASNVIAMEVALDPPRVIVEGTAHAAGRG